MEGNLNPSSGIINRQEGYLNPSSGIINRQEGYLNPSSGIINLQEGYLNLSSGIIKPPGRKSESLQWNYKHPLDRYLNPSSGM